MAYQYHGCRCEPCRAAEAAYHCRYAKGLIAGWVDAAPARERLEHLKAFGVGARRVAELCDLSVQTVRAIRDGSRRVIHPRTAAAIMNTRASVAGGTLMPQAESYQTRERLRRLLEEEYPRDWLRNLLGEHTVRSAERRKGRGETGALVTARTWGRVKLLHRWLLFDDHFHST